MQSLDPFQSEVAQIALGVAAEHGFALGGGQALIAHGIVLRPTEDIDLFTNSEDGVRSAVASVAEPRDFVDVAAAMNRYNRQELVELAARSDPALITEEFAEAMRMLDRIPDAIFSRWIVAESVGALRAAFADWPRY